MTRRLRLEPRPCGHPAPVHAHGLCRPCYALWWHGGKETEDGRPVVPPPGRPGRPPVGPGQFEDFCWIRAGQGERPGEAKRWRVEEAGRRAGVRTRTAWALEARRLRQGAAA